MLILKSGAKLRFFFGLCKCLSDNFLKCFLIVKDLRAINS